MKAPAMTERTESVVKESDESVAPLVFMYIWFTVAWLVAIIAWVFYFRGYA
jgi:hypothetical protein